MGDQLALIRALPKAELHLHIEGTLEPELMFELARRNGVKLAFADVDELRRAYDFKDLQSFLDLYYAGADVLRTRADFDALASAYLARMAAENVRHVEIFFDPQTHTARGIALADVVEGLVDALSRAERDHGITWRLIPCILRHLDEADALGTLARLEPWLHRFTALGLDSSERGHPPSKFARVFARARSLGLKTVAHAGEEGPPAYITEAIDQLQVARIDHGVRCLEDPAVTRRLRDLGMPLTVCPLSNVRLRVFPTMARHNLGALLEAGLVVTVNSDDPAYFGGYLSENYQATAAALDLSDATIVALAANGFRASFLDPAAKQRHLGDIAAVARRLGVAIG
ncbi:MAG: adenosine deaminase [Alphaproteobacteria bacterium]|nr:adenosine deaminase [Alphaproteobacteria bacterium]